MMTHDCVDLDSPHMSLLSMTVYHNFHLKLDVKISFLNSPLAHEFWVRFSSGYDHSPREAFAKLHISLCGLNIIQLLTGMLRNICA